MQIRGGLVNIVTVKVIIVPVLACDVVAANFHGLVTRPYAQ